MGEQLTTMLAKVERVLLGNRESREPISVSFLEQHFQEALDNLRQNE